MQTILENMYMKIYSLVFDFNADAFPVFLAARCRCWTSLVSAPCWTWTWIFCWAHLHRRSWHISSQATWASGAVVDEVSNACEVKSIFLSDER